MQRKEFENRIKSLLPKAADNVVESWAEYATELDQDGTEAAADFYDKNYIAKSRRDRAKEKRLRRKWKKPENISGFFCCLVSKIKFLSVVIMWRQSAA